MSLFSLLKPLARPLYRTIRLLWLRGSRYYCPLCEGRFRQFLPKGDPRRANAMCPRCGSLERHRLLWLFLSQTSPSTGNTSLSPKPLKGGLRILHMAPEPALAARLRALPGCEYRSGDREIGRADDAFDLTAIPHGDNRFDRILCCHVLEHIPDDMQALREMHRVLAPGGQLIVQVPLGQGPTQEDADVTDPLVRRKLFGQEDHVRLYGYDLADRMREVGFKVRIEKPFASIANADRETMRLAPDGEEGEPIFVAEK